MSKGEYIPRSVVLDRLKLHRQVLRTADYRHGLDQAIGIVNSLEGIDLKGNLIEVTTHDDNKNVIKVGSEIRFDPSEASDGIKELFYIELRSRITEKTHKAWRMYLTEEGIKKLEKQLHDIVEQDDKSEAD